MESEWKTTGGAQTRGDKQRRERLQRGSRSATRDYAERRRSASRGLAMKTQGVDSVELRSRLKRALRSLKSLESFYASVALKLMALTLTLIKSLLRA